MRVAELMQTDVKAIESDATIAEAIQVMADEHVSGLPVIDSKGAFVGVVSTSDILEATAESETPEERTRLFDKTRVSEIMTRRPLTVEPDDEIVDVARRILYLEVHRLFVTWEGKLEGVVSQTDLVRAMATSRNMAL